MDPRTSRDTIIASMAKTLWVTAWADEIEERSSQGDEAARAVMRNWPRNDLMDLAPEVPPTAYVMAATLTSAIESLSQMPLEAALAACCDVVDAEAADEFGHYLVMEALGSGVSWTDDGAPPHGMTLPVSFENFSLRDEVKP